MTGGIRIKSRVQLTGGGDITESQPLIPALNQSLTPQTGVAAPRLTLVAFSLGLINSKLEVFKPQQ